MSRQPDPKARGELVRAALREFRRVGLKGARVEDIAKASGLAKGSFYLHFDSKEALFEEQVAGYLARLDRIIADRHATVMSGIEAGKGPAALVEVDKRFDRATLELLWEARELAGVLIHGAQGTRFQGVLWENVAREKARLKAACETLKGMGAARADLDAEVFASAVVGTYLLMIEAMGHLAEKPNLEAWVDQVQLLFKESLGGGLPAARGEEQLSS